MDATPTAGKVATIGGVNLALTLAKAAAGFAAGHGLIGTNNVEMWTGIIVLILTYAWSLWTDYGSVIAKASLDILRAKVLNAAELAQSRPAAAPAALAQLATHVEVTAPEPAPVVTATPPVASAIVLAIGLAALGLGWPAAAQAQTPRVAPRAESVPAPGLPRPPICDPLNLLPGCHVEVSGAAGGKTGTQPVELDIWKKIADAALPDLDYASALAAAASTDGGNVRKQCWDALIKANKQASGVGVKNPDGTPMTKPDPHLFVDVESLAEVLDNLTPKGPLWTACAGAAQLAGTSVLTFINAIVTGSAGLAALGVT